MLVTLRCNLRRTVYTISQMLAEIRGHLINSPLIYSVSRLHLNPKILIIIWKMHTFWYVSLIFLLFHLKKVTSLALFQANNSSISIHHLTHTTMPASRYEATSAYISSCGVSPLLKQLSRDTCSRACVSLSGCWVCLWLSHPTGY